MPPTRFKRPRHGNQRSNGRWPYGLKASDADLLVADEVIAQAPATQGERRYRRFTVFVQHYQARGEVDRRAALKTFVGQGIQYLRASSIVTYLTQVRKECNLRFERFSPAEMAVYLSLKRGLQAMATRAGADGASHIPNEDAQKVVSQVAKFDQAAAFALYLLFAIGIRPVEAERARRASLHVGPREISLKVLDGKTVHRPQDAYLMIQSMDNVPIKPPGDFAAYLGTISDDAYPFAHCSAAHLYRCMRRSWSDSPHSPYSFRKAFALRMYLHFRDEEKVSKMLGHRNIRIAGAFYLDGRSIVHHPPDPGINEDSDTGDDCSVKESSDADP